MSVKWLFQCCDVNKFYLAQEWAPDEWEPIPINSTAVPEMIPGMDYYDLDDHARKFGDVFWSYYRHTRKGWALGTKLLWPLVIKEPFVFSDDDVIFTRHPQPLIDEGAFGECYGFDKLSWNIKECRRMEILQEVFELDWMDVDRYNDLAFNCGVWYAPHYHDWERYMHRFWTSNYFDGLSYTSNRFRCLDQAFMRGYAAKMDWEGCHHVDTKRTFMRGPEHYNPTYDKLMKGFWVHYAASTHKPAYMKLLREINVRTAT